MKRSLKDSVKAIITALDERRTLGVAAEMSFWLFCALLPLAYSAMTLLVFVNREAIESLASLFTAIPDETRRLVARELGSVLDKQGAPSIATALLGIWLGSSGLHAIFDGFDAQLRCTTPWLQKRLRALGGCVALSVGTAIVGFVVRYLGSVLHGAVATLVGAAIVFAVLYLVVAGLYLLGMPSAGLRPDKTPLPRAPGTLVVVIVVGLVAFGYKIYLRVLGDGSAFQAGLSVIVTTLTGLYLFSTALLLGLYVNQRIAEAKADGATTNKVSASAA